jgi:hypothetical protein
LEEEVEVHSMIRAKIPPTNPLTFSYFFPSAAPMSTNDSPTGREENEMCKVCMDHIIDCVFLECGHLVTCVDCGRQLRECPLCRQNIVRIVRVFKS